MRIGIPREIKPREGRVGLTPEACGELVHAGHELFLEQGAGAASGFADAQYQALGVTILPDAAALYERARMIVKVKEPIGPELELLRREHLLFCYLHLAASEPLTRRLQEIGLTAVAFETVEEQGHLPLLAPMSDIAGRIAVQVGAHLLYRTEGGKGVLLGGLPGTPRGRVVVLGAGCAGESAARVAANLGAQVTVFEKRRERLAAMYHLGRQITALYSYQSKLAEAVRQADLLIGAVLIPGAKAPTLVTEALVKEMQPGSVIVDISVDQGGCIETIHPTSYEAPTYKLHDILHFGVTNMPGAVPRTASLALSAAITPYALLLAAGGWEQNPALRAGVNLRDGRIEYPALRALFGAA